MNLTQRVVFDTSTLIGAVLRPGSVPRQALLAAAKRNELCVSEATLNELQTVLQRPKFDVYATPQARLDFLTLYSERTRWWAVDAAVEQRAAGACRDPKDDKFLALALACQADNSVTGAQKQNPGSPLPPGGAAQQRQAVACRWRGKRPHSQSECSGRGE